MYASFFGLQHEPFSIAPDPRYLFMSERHREALAHFLYGLGGGGGFVLLTGEIGTGKTTVCRCFLEQMPADCNVAYIFNPKLTVAELLRSICDEFGVAHAPAVPGAETVKDCLDPLNAFLLQAHAAGRNNVLIIDEAQNLSADVLEQLRLLTNLETNERKLLQIVLIGQPELRTLLAQPALEQLAQRVIARFHLDALSADETQHYIAHRLDVAGLAGPLPFDRRALRRIHAMARGVPRRINLLCDRALLGAYAGGVRTVDDRTVERAAREVFGGTVAEGTRAPRRWALAGGGVLAAAVLAGAVGWSAGRARPPAPLPVALPAAPVAPVVPVAAPQVSPVAAEAPFDLSAVLASLPHDEGDAWRTLAKSWKVALEADAAATDLCAQALPQQGLQCFRSSRTSLGLIRQLDRPGILALVGEDGRPVQALLTGLDGQRATLSIGGVPRRVALTELARWWRGDFATLWRMPPGAEGAPSADVAARRAGEWFDTQLAAAQPALPSEATDKPAATRKARIYRFQLAHGLTPDGRTGPLTFMLLNRAAAVDEPRLHSGA
ncbi:AAA family ATPase [Xylophilus sp. GW821-FHT01B05]